MAEVTASQNDELGGGRGWRPFVGEETNDLLRSKGFTNPDRTLSITGGRILDETRRIMEACGNPAANINSDTGLVIGYVQSGKTLSFTTVTALARDNNFQIVIILGGTSIPLLNQSTRRIEGDLRIADRYGYEQRWILLKNPATQEDIYTISNCLAQWADPSFPNDECKTILITVMKQKDHLRNIADLFDRIGVTNVPTLIIDDEGDQASLNTLARRAARDGRDIETLNENEVSTIYRRITRLKGLFQNHTFLTYTATPQANLFINIVDRLSPNFIKLLTPGEEYTGGIEFFRRNPTLIQTIPATDLSTPNQPLPGPPDSLLNALRIFYLGVVAGKILRSYQNSNQRNRSMLVHPSRLQGDHITFFGWINTLKDSWARILSGNDEEDKNQLLTEFRNSYEILRSTVEDLPSFEILSGQELGHIIQYTPVVEVNSRGGSTPEIRWQNSYSWILVGGQSMDRGFTVEGLTVTYMPRNVGTANVDTIQQRARFYGYKRSYLMYCRVFLDQVTIDAYNDIVDHEEDIRRRLTDYNINNVSLDEWQREVVLSQMLNLTRPNVLYDALDREHFGDEWFRINAPHDTEEYIGTNREAIYNFVREREGLFVPDSGNDRRTIDQRHLVARLPLVDCVQYLLNRLKFTRQSDSVTFSSLRGVLKRYYDQFADAECAVYLMTARSINEWPSRIRSLNLNNDEIRNLFQGRNPLRGDIIYPGDSEIRQNGLLTIQIHMLNIRDTDFTDVPTVAIWVPGEMETDIIRQM
jgi:Z1 domain